MADLRLPRGPDELLEAVRRPLGRAFGGEYNLRLGGGTVLAARWQHRHSTDVDLFVDSDAYHDFRWDTGRRFTLALTAAAPVDRLVVGDDGTFISFHGLPGHVTIHVARGLPFDPRSSDTAHGTEIPLETNAEILAKKFLLRMAIGRQLPARDLYDIAVARERDLVALRTALDALRTEQLAEILKLFKDRRPSRRPLLAPADPVLAEQAPALVERLFRDTHRNRSPDRGHGPPLTR